MSEQGVSQNTNQGANMRSDYCELAIVLDRSGSMSTVKNDMEGGFARLMEEQRKLPGECRVTLTQFDTQGIDTVYESKPVADVPALVLEPRGGTPLLDAVGDAVTSLGKRLAAKPEAERPGSVVVLIITDGEENSSTRFTKAQVKELVERQTTTYKWSFIYLGANVDAFAEAGSMGIAAAAAASYTPDSAGVKAAYFAASASVGRSRSGGTADLTQAERDAMNIKGAN